MVTPHDTLTLASASPRRQRLLAWLGEPYTIMPTDTVEDLDSPLAADPEALARFLAAEKARAARAAGAPGTVLGFDTIVVLDRAVLGKPRDRAEARRMLEALSGRMHDVVTGCAIVSAPDKRTSSFAVTTPVRMQELDEDAVAAWLAGDEVLGCAGAYNIEHHLAEVELDQCFQNVAGLPLCHLLREMRAADPATAERMHSPIPACNGSRSVSCALGPRLLPD